MVTRDKENLELDSKITLIVRDAYCFGPATSDIVETSEGFTYPRRGQRYPPVGRQTVIYIAPDCRENTACPDPYSPFPYPKRSKTLHRGERRESACPQYFEETRAPR